MENLEPHEKVDRIKEEKNSESTLKCGYLGLEKKKKMLSVTQNMMPARRGHGGLVPKLRGSLKGTETPQGKK